MRPTHQRNEAGSAATLPLRLSDQAPSVWRLALPLSLLLVGFILILYRDTVTAMVTIWYRSETFTHAFVVPPIVAWLIWRKRQESASVTPSPALPALLLMGGAALLWLLGALAAVNSVTQLALIAMLVLVVPVLLGLEVARTIIFPLAFLFFAVPIGEFLLPQLMEWTAHFTIIALRLSGIPVYQEGLQFIIPSGSWSVVEACSGVRYLIASLTVGTLFAYLNYHSTKRRLLFVLVAILVPIVANWMRAYMIVMLGHLSGNTIAVGVDHLIYGWVFFGVVIMLLFIVGARWAEPEVTNVAHKSSRASIQSNAPAVRFLFAGICIAMIVALPAIGRWAMERNRSSGVPVLVAPDILERGWKEIDAGAIGFKPAFQNPSAEIDNVYVADGKRVGLYLGYYWNQDYSRKLISSDNVLVTSKDTQWSRVSSGMRSIVFGQETVKVRTAELRRLPLSGPDQGGRLVVWQLYWIDGTLTSSDYLAKAYSAIYRLIGRGDHSAVVVLYTTMDQSSDPNATLESFLSANYGAINAVLRRAKGNN